MSDISKLDEIGMVSSNTLSPQGFIEFKLELSDIHTDHIYANFIGIKPIKSKFNSNSKLDLSLLADFYHSKFGMLYLDHQSEADEDSSLNEFTINYSFSRKSNELAYHKISSTLFISEEWLNLLFSKIANGEIGALHLDMMFDEKLLVKKLSSAWHEVGSSKEISDEFNIPISSWAILYK